MDWLIGHPLLRRRLVVFITLLAALAVALVPATATAAVERDTTGDRASEWIAREYREPDSEIKLFGTGILIDSLVSLAATGAQAGTALEMLDDLEAQADAYVGTGDALSVGGAGKLIHVLEVYGEDVAAFVGRGVIAELRASMQTTGSDTGRFAEAAVLDQALAVLGLSMTAEGAPAEAVAWLAGSQCPSGEFTYDGTCPGATDADTTGIAVLALIAAGDTTTPELSLDWLESLLLTTGAVPGYGTPNTNSTAAAAVAFKAAGRDDAARATTGYLVSMQFDDPSDPDNFGGYKWIESDTQANTFATVQAVWGDGAVAPLHLIEAPTLEFSDIDGTVFGAEIRWLALADITRGCNPPLNDSFCPLQPVTRGEMAAFLERALDLPFASGSGFTDIDDSQFGPEIEAVAAVGITKGCNPPANDMFCPDDVVTRGQMAAFLGRALDLSAAPGSSFLDSTGSVFASDIEAIAAAGITKGCNPPANDMFCPNDPVTREQMAAFIYRAMHQ